MKNPFDIIFETPTHTKKDIDHTICYFCKIKLTDPEPIWENILGMRGHPECGEKHWDGPIRAESLYQIDKQFLEWAAIFESFNKKEFKHE